GMLRDQPVGQLLVRLLLLFHEGAAHGLYPVSSAAETLQGCSGPRACRQYRHNPDNLEIATERGTILPARERTAARGCSAARSDRFAAMRDVAPRNGEAIECEPKGLRGTQPSRLASHHSSSAAPRSSRSTNLRGAWRAPSGCGSSLRREVSPS